MAQAICVRFNAAALECAIRLARLSEEGLARAAGAMPSRAELEGAVRSCASARRQSAVEALSRLDLRADCRKANRRASREAAGSLYCLLSELALAVGGGLGRMERGAGEGRPPARGHRPVQAADDPRSPVRWRG